MTYLPLGAPMGITLLIGLMDRYFMVFQNIQRIAQLLRNKIKFIVII